MLPVRVDPFTPETGGDIFPMVVQPLVGGAFVKRPALGAVRADFHVVECIPEFGLYLLAAGIQGDFQGRMGCADVGGEGQECIRIAPLPQEKEAVHSEVVRNQMVDNCWGQLLTNIQFQEWRMASYAISPAVAYVDC